MTNIRVYPAAAALAQAAAEHIVSLAQAAITAQGRFSISLSGGSTPHETYRLLAAPPLPGRVDWSKVYVFWGDERCVPPDHPDSDFKMAREALLDHVPLPPGNIHRIRAETDPTDAAAEYEQVLRRFFGENPRFDLVLLGMGDDGHTASLFPHTDALNEMTRWVAANFVPGLNVWRITLTPPVINAAAHILFLVSGETKAERLKQVLQGPYQPHELPAQMVNPENGQLLWFVDAAAAAKL